MDDNNVDTGLTHICINAMIDEKILCLEKDFLVAHAAHMLTFSGGKCRQWQTSQKFTKTDQSCKKEPTQT